MGTERENNKLVVNLMPSELGGKTQEVIFREGAAARPLDPKAPVKTNIVGVISTPAEYIKKRGEILDYDSAHILVSRENVSITLITNEADDYRRGQIKGVLAFHPQFIAFGINASKVWDPNELGQFFKMNRSFFPDKKTNMALVSQLKNFEATVNSRIEKQNSEKGDFKDNYSGMVMSNLPEAFFLEIPVFKGTPRETIEVEFYATVNGREVGLQLMSPSAVQLLEEQRDKAIDEVLESIVAMAPEIAIIEQ